jgi:hypothetical protein
VELTSVYHNMLRRLSCKAAFLLWILFLGGWRLPGAVHTCIVPPYRLSAGIKKSQPED